MTRPAWICFPSCAASSAVKLPAHRGQDHARYGEQGQVNFPIPESLHQSFIRDTISTVINCPLADLNNQADETLITVFILFERFMRRRGLHET